ncbi:MAG TPA: PEP/pyruvate-binding domain-containing protein, partial [Arenicellales bacterium]|nr:PEP/pyruvate-binding domain-containing protein [Arenicellales bacterium]
MDRSLIWFDRLGMRDVARVGGKNASLGEMISNLADTGIRVPEGFATTAEAYQRFLEHDNLNRRIHEALEDLDVEDVDALTRCGAQIRQWVMDTPLPAEFEQDISTAYRELEDRSGKNVSVAVRSSATAE